MINRCIVFLILLMLSGCQVRFPQINNILHSFTESEDPIVDFRFIASIGNYSTELIAIKVNNGIVYANQNDEAVHVVNGKVRKLQTFGPNKITLTFKDSEIENSIEREIIMDGRRNQIQYCDAWQNQPNGQQTMTCKANGVVFINKLQLDEQARVVSLQQVIDNSGTLFLLNKKPTR